MNLSLLAFAPLEFYLVLIFEHLRLPVHKPVLIAVTTKNSAGNTARKAFFALLVLSPN